MALSKNEKVRLDWRDKLRINYKLIVEGTRLAELLDDFYEGEIFTEEDCEMIKQFDGLENEKNRKFLDILLLKNESSFQRFLNHLTESDRGDIVNVIKNTNVSKKPKSTGKFKASADWKEKILRNYKTIVHQSDLERLLDALYSEEILTDEEKGTVKAQTTTNAKNRQIISILLQKTHIGYESLLENLRKSTNCELADVIDKTCVKETPVHARELQNTEEVNLRRRIFLLRRQIIDDSKLDDSLDEFVSARVIDINDLDCLKNIVSRQERNQVILDMIFRKSYSCFGLLMEMLQSNNELVMEIESIVVDESVDKEIKDMYFLSTQTDIIPVTKRDQAEVQLTSWKEAKYVEVKFSRAVLESARKSMITTVTGNSGTGKTATIHFAALQLAVDGYDILPVSNLKELLRYLHPGYKQAFVIDNPVGSQKLDEDELEIWVQQNEVLRNLNSENTKILCSLRNEIINDKAFERSQTALGQNVIDLQDPAISLTLDEKLLILKSHLQSQYDINDELKETIAKVDMSFPLLCEMFANNGELEKSGTLFFENPIAFLMKDLDNMSPEKYCVLILCLCQAPLMARDFIDTSTTWKQNSKYRSTFANILNSCKLQPSIPIECLREQLDPLTKVYLRKDGLFYDFSHVMTRNVVACHFGKSKQVPFLNICPSEQILDLVSVNTSKETLTNPQIIHLDKQNIPDLLLRLLTDINNGEYNPATLHNCWDDERVLRCFVDILGDQRLILKCFQKNVLNIFCESRRSKLKQKMKGKEDERENSSNETTTDSETEDDENKGNVRKVDVTESWSWHHTAMQCLELPGVTPVHWIAAFARRRLFRIIWRNLSEKQKKRVVARMPLIHYAFIGGDREICTSLLEEQDHILDVPLSCDEQTGVSTLFPIHFAVMRSLGVEDLLLTQDINVNIWKTAEGYTPLFIAVAYGNIKDTERLITKHGANVNQSSSNGWTPLMISVQNSHIDITECLLENDAKINEGDRNGWNPLHIAVQNNNVEAARLLLKYGASVDQTDKEHRSPLIKSVQKNLCEMTFLLLSHQASVNRRNINGNCPLHIVAQNNHIKMATLLFEDTKQGNGIDLEAHNKYGNSPLQVAVKNNSNDVAELFVQKKAHLNDRDGRGRTPLVNAVSKGNNKLVELLIQSGADIDISSNNGNSALHFAVQEKYLPLTELLLQRGANVNLLDGNWDSPLIKAVVLGNIEIAGLLIEHRANVNHCDTNGVTPLMVAAQKNKIDMVSLLLSAGADKKMQSIDGRYAFQFSHSMEIVTKLADSAYDAIFQKHIKKIESYSKQQKKAAAKEIAEKRVAQRRAGKRGDRPIMQSGGELLKYPFQANVHFKNDASIHVYDAASEDIHSDDSEYEDIEDSDKEISISHTVPIHREQELEYSLHPEKQKHISLSHSMSIPREKELAYTLYPGKEKHFIGSVCPPVHEEKEFEYSLYPEKEKHISLSHSMSMHQEKELEYSLSPEKIPALPIYK